MAVAYVLVEDVVKAGYCAHGMRAWARGNNWDFRKLLAGQYTLAEAKALSCPMAQRVCAQIELRVEEEGRNGR